ncbi:MULTISPECIES: hypothetical protein [unclassified Stenotrophomonas maltophilia group]|uniref:hypothetical protein n=1 Tax=unclassified Stenotrophomonas maltophilia group TaxID=2961925 RepID=UPI003BF79780
MSTEKTLADVQPGGRVRLGDQAELDRHEFQAWARELLPCPFCGNGAEFVPYKDNGLTLKCKSMGCIQRNQRTLRYGIDWLRTSMAEHWNTRARSAQPSPGATALGLPIVVDPTVPPDTFEVRQPSPGGQRDDSPMAKMAAALRGKAEAERAAFDQRVQSGEWGPMPDNPDVLELPPLPEEVDSVRCMIRGEKGFAEPCDYYFTSKQMRDYARTALAASQPVSETDAYQQGFRDGQDRTCTVVARQPVGEPVVSDLSGYAVAASQVRRGYDVECDRCGKFCDEGPGPCQPAQDVDLGPVRDVFRRWHANELNSTDAMLALVEALAVIDSRAVGK